MTGTHNFKTGLLYAWGNNPSTIDMNGDLYQLYQGGSLVGNQYTLGQPRQVRVYNTPIERRPEARGERRRLRAGPVGARTGSRSTTGSAGSILKEEIPAQERVAGRFAPAQHYDAVTCESMPGMTCWKSWAPRLGVAYDLFGNGRTALKMSYGKYMTPDVSTFANLFNPIATFTDTRTWTDTNGDDIAQDDRDRPSNNPNFGRITNRTLDPNFSREYNTQWSATVQHELRPGMAANVQLVPPLAVQHRVHQQPCGRSASPIGRRPASSARSTGESITVYQINQNKNGIAPDLYLTNLTDTDLRANIFTGCELGMNARLPRRILVFGGWGMEKAVDVDCAINTVGASGTLNNPNTLRFCDQSGELYQELGENANDPLSARVQVQRQRAAVVRRRGERVAPELSGRHQGGGRRRELGDHARQHALPDRLHGARLHAWRDRAPVALRG